MAEGVEQERCPICLDKFREPKLLQCCKHQFCSTCLEDYIYRSSIDNENIREFQCPWCRELTKIPAEGNGYLNSNPTKSWEIKCDACDGIAARFRCKDCRQNFCNVCNKMHSGLKKHDVIKLTEQTESPIVDVPWISLGEKDVCVNHAAVKAEYYCQKCIIACCSDCFSRGHANHTGFLLKEKKTQEMIKFKLQTMMEETKTHLKKAEELSAGLNDKFQKTSNMTETLCGKVDDQVQLLCTELKKQGDIIKGEIKNFCMVGKRNTSIYGQVDTINFAETKTTMQTVVEDIKASIKCSGLIFSDEVCLVPLIERISKIEKENQNYSTKLKIQDYEVREMSFQGEKVNPDTLRNQIGSITRKGEPKKDTIPNFWCPAISQSISSSGSIHADIEESDDSFQFSFELNKVRRNIYHGPKFILEGINWNIGVKRVKHMDLLEVYLRCNDDVSIDVNFSIELRNWHGYRSKIINGKHFFDFEDDEVWFDLINWSNVCNPQSGFLDDDEFTIEVTIEQL